MDLSFSKVFEEIAIEKKEKDQEILEKESILYRKTFEEITILIKKAYRMNYSQIHVSGSTPKSILDNLRQSGCNVEPVYEESIMTNCDVLKSYRINLPILK